MSAWDTPFLQAHRAELIAFRRHLHTYPELSRAEHETTALVAQRLQVAGLSPQVRPDGCGLVCDIGTGAGPVVALRADLDALAMDDDKQVPYRSQHPGVAHACGHDVHTSAVLGAGLALAERLRDSPVDGRVRLLFEPAEESLPGGAVDLIDEGGLEGVVAVFGLHCDPKIDVGTIAVREGPLTSATDMVHIELNGPGGHTARPQLTVDLVAVAARVAATLPALVHDRAAPQGEALLVFGALLAGDAANVIPAHAELRGTFRTPSPEVWGQGEPLVRELLPEVVGDRGATWKLDYQRGIPPVVNDPTETARVAAVARALLGSQRVVEAPRSLGGDSFAWYLERVPGSYVRLGVHDPTAATERLDLHSSLFDVHEDAIGIGVQVLTSTALAVLGVPPS